MFLHYLERCILRFPERNLVGRLAMHADLFSGRGERESNPMRNEMEISKNR